MSLVYLLASLPMLEFSTAPRVKVAEFLQLCREQLSPRDAALIEAMATAQPLDHPFARAWQAHETALRNAVARERARRLNHKNVAQWLRPQSTLNLSLNQAVATAMQRESPLERERALDKLRWEAAEHLGGLDALSFNALLAYTLKLTIATRWRDLESERAQANFDQRAQLPTDMLAEHSATTPDDTE